MEWSAPAAGLAPADLGPRRWWALALLCGAFFMVLLDGTITIVALPSIGADLRFSEQGLQWVLSAYANQCRGTSGRRVFRPDSTPILTTHAARGGGS